jgi:hypothetical protein
MPCIQGSSASRYLLVNFTALEVLAAIIYCPVNIEAVHLDAIALVKRVPDNGTLVLVCI